MNNLIDNLITTFDESLRTIAIKPMSSRPNPASAVPKTDLSSSQKRKVAGLMRVNHTGEVCAQALYTGQALCARSPAVKNKMQLAAIEENDHLNWCHSRLDELNSHRSYLNPAWYLGALALGITAGVLGDKWSLGFLAETEKQVTSHLDSHLKMLPANDHMSRAIVSQMRDDEAKHATLAIESGGAPLPQVVKTLMKFSAKVMTSVAYYI